MTAAYRSIAACQPVVLVIVNPPEAIAGFVEGQQVDVVVTAPRLRVVSRSIKVILA